MPSRINNLVSPIITFLFLWTIYLTTLAPTISPDDAGELITASYTLGISHPPGYSFYALFTSCWLNLPLGSIALRANLGSLGCICLAMLVVFFLLRCCLLNGSLSIIGALTAGVLPTTWRQAALSEVYALHLLFSLLTLYFILRPASKSKAYQTSMVWGFSLLAHYQNLFLFPFVVFRLWRLRQRGLTLLLVLGITSLSLLYFPLRATTWPNLNWGVPTNVNRLMNHLSRAQYQEINQGHSLLASLTQWGYFVKLQARELPPILLILPVIGLAYLARRARGQMALLVALYLAYFLLSSHFLNYANFTRASYLGPKFLLLNSTILVILLTSGLAQINQLLPLKKLLAIGLCLPLFLLLSNKSQSDFSSYFTVSDYTSNLQAQLPQNSRLFLNEDFEIFPLTFTSLVEGKRPDLAIFDFNSEPFESIFENLDPLKIYNISYDYSKINRGLHRKEPLYLAYNPPNIRIKLYPLGYFYSAGQPLPHRLDTIPFRYKPQYADYANRYLAARFYLAQSLRTALSSPQQSARDLQTSSELSYDQSTLKRQLAKAYQNLGQNQKAQAEFSQALRLEKQGL